MPITAVARECLAARARDCACLRRRCNGSDRAFSPVFSVPPSAISRPAFPCCARAPFSFKRGYLRAWMRTLDRLDSCVASVIELAFSGCIGRRYLVKNKIENASKLLQTRPEQLGVVPRQNVHGLRAWKYRAPRPLRMKKP